MLKDLAPSCLPFLVASIIMEKRKKEWKREKRKKNGRGKEECKREKPIAIEEVGLGIILGVFVMRK